MGPGDLKHTLRSLVPDNENVLVGFENSEDASVYKINENEAIVQTVDFITPVVDDPYIYGKIAAANSLSDVFAMGAEVKTALNIVGFDKTNHGYEVLSEILRGGNEKVIESGGVLVGGHTPKIGHVLVLTKPIGLGILTTAIKRDLLKKETTLEAVKVMETLNHLPSKLLGDYDVSACTDITGFGLLGHAFESTNDTVTLSIDAQCVPVMADAFELAGRDVVPGGSKRNMSYLEDKVTYVGDASKYALMFCDAQTSGGLLISMNEKDAVEYVKRVEDLTYGYACVIGSIIPRGDRPIIVY